MEERNRMFKLAKKLKSESTDITGDKCVLDDEGNMAFDDQAKLEAWRCHHERLLNLEFPWDSDALPEVPPTQGPPICITDTMVKEAVDRMKTSKAAGPTGITAELLQAAEESIISAITILVNCIIRDGKMYQNAKASVWVNNSYSLAFSVTAGVHQGSVLSPLLSIMVMEALSQDFRKGCP